MERQQIISNEPQQQLGKIKIKDVSSSDHNFDLTFEDYQYKTLEFNSSNELSSDNQQKCQLLIAQQINDCSTSTIFTSEPTTTARQRIIKTASLKVISNDQIDEDLTGEVQIEETEDFFYEERKVYDFSALPNWLQDNDFIRFGYRPPLPSLNSCFKSMFRIHTETGNIWTHGIGCIVFLILAIYMISFTNLKPIDKLMLGIYFSGAITCLLFSTLFHTMLCHSPEVHKTMAKFDYCGISIQIIGSMIPAFYYGFYNEQKFFWIYISVGSILCLMSVIVSLLDRFCKPEARVIRASVFLSFGLSNIVPGIHMFFFLESEYIIYYSMIIIQGLLYTIGGLLYAMRIPERYFPGKCDYLFQSHQIFHILVVLAAIVHLIGICGQIYLRSIG